MTLRYLLDTCVISEFVKPNPVRQVVDWLNRVDGDLTFLSAVTFGEIQMRISQLPPSNRRTELEVWLAGVLTAQFAGRVLALDVDTFRIWGQMAAQRKQQGAPMAVMDSLIAATAAQHGMVLVTRHVADFKTTGLPLLNPWA